MNLTQAQLLTYLQQHQIPYQLYQHAPVFTCEAATKVIEELQIPGVGIKNLFLKDSKQRLYHIVATYHTRVDLKKTGAELGAKELRFANAELLMQHLGVEPGSVTPLALINDVAHTVQIIVDVDLFKHALIQVHPLNNSATVVITQADLIKFFTLLQRTYITYDFTQNQIVSAAI